MRRDDGGANLSNLWSRSSPASSTLAIALLILPKVAALQLKPPVATYFGCRYRVSTAARVGGGGAKVCAAWICGPSPPQTAAPLSACAAAHNVRTASRSGR